jgi:tetratricopeptide (TPR) repeat protein
MPTLPALTLTALALSAVQIGKTDVDVAARQAREEAREHFRLGVEKLAEESWDEAEREFSAAVELDPLLAMAYYGLGQARMSGRRYPEAIQAFSDCRETHKKLIGLQQSNSSLADQRREEEIRELKESIRLVQSGTVKTASAQNTVLNLESRLRQLENERSRGGAATLEVPAEVSLALGSAYFRSGDLEGAEREYREAIRVNSKLGEAHNNLAVVCMLTGKLDEAQIETKAAEASGFRVNPRFKEDLERAVAEAAQR